MHISNYFKLTICIVTLIIPRIGLTETDPSSLRLYDLGNKISELIGNHDKKDELLIYLNEMERRSNSKNPEAMYMLGRYNQFLCNFLKKTGVDAGENGPSMCVKALNNFKEIADNSKIRILYYSSASMSALGEMYRDGIGTKPSQYLAADWFVKSAKLQSTNGDREGAIRALEDALKAVPEYPPAIEASVTIFKQQ